MASSYPGSLDSLPTVSASDNMNSSGVLHDVVHTDANNAIEAAQAWIGARAYTNQNSSWSIDWFLRQRAYNPFHYRWGFINDGTSGDTTRLQNCFTDAAADGKAVYLPAICQITSPITVVNSQVVIGDGETSGLKMVAATTQTAVISMAASLQITDVRLHNFVVDANLKATNGILASNGVVRGRFEGLYVKNAITTGIYLNSNGASGSTTKGYDTRVTGCQIEGSGTVANYMEVGIHVGESGQTDGWYHNNITKNFTDCGYWDDSAANVWFQCHAYTGQPVATVSVQSAFRLGAQITFVTGCQINATKHSIEFAGSGKYYIWGNTIRTGIDSDSSAYHFVNATNGGSNSQNHVYVWMNNIYRRAVESSGSTPSTVTGDTGVVLSAPFRFEDLDGNNITLLQKTDVMGTAAVSSGATSTTVTISDFLHATSGAAEQNNQFFPMMTNASVTGYSYNRTTHVLTVNHSTTSTTGYLSYWAKSGRQGSITF